MLTLQQLLAGKTIPQLLHWADTLDPNNSWDELTSVTASQLAAYMASAYDNEDVINWINR